jgi:hypothetical protein
LRRGLPIGLAVLAVGLVVVGVLVFVAADEPTWTAYSGGYQPLETEEAYSSELRLSFDNGWAVIWTGSRLLGAVLAGAGLLVGAAVAGWAAGRRSVARR